MMRSYLYRQFLMPSHEAYYDFSDCYELTWLVDKVLAVLAIGNFGNCGQGFHSDSQLLLRDVLWYSCQDVYFLVKFLENI